MKLFLRQIGWEQKSFWRNPPSAVFTFVFPLLFLVIFSLINADDRIGPDGKEINFIQFYVPSIVAFGVISATYTNLAFTMTFRREFGVLKRKRGTPLSPATYLGASIANGVIIALMLTALTIATGWAAFDFSLAGAAWRIPATIAIVLFGAACFAAMGLAMTCLIRNQDAAPAVINALLFPLLFISGTFGPVASGSLLDNIASLFPVKHFSLLLGRVWNPYAQDPIVRWQNIVVLIGWGVVAAAAAVKYFKWEANTASGQGRSRRSRRPQ